MTIFTNTLDLLYDVIYSFSNTQYFNFCLWVAVFIVVFRIIRGIICW